MILTRPDKWSAVGGVMPNPVEYTIASALPVVTVQLFISGILSATIRQRTREGEVTIDVSAFLRSLLQPSDERETFPVNLPADRVEKKQSATLSYYIKYFDDSNTLISDESQVRYGSRSALQALPADITEYLIADTSPVYEFDLTTVVCKQDAPRSTSATLAKLRDVNPLSLTYNAYKTPGDYAGDLFDFAQDATLCPIAIINTEPNWQPVLSTIKCEQDAPRTSAQRVAKVIDMNPDSPYYNQYGIGVEATVGTSDINAATFYYYDTNASACPIYVSPDPGEIDAFAAEYNYGVSPNRVKIKVRRISGNNAVEVTGKVIIETVGTEIPQGNALNFFLGAGAEYYTIETSFGVDLAGDYQVKVSEVNTLDFAPGAAVIALMKVTEFTF